MPIEEFRKEETSAAVEGSKVGCCLVKSEVGALSDEGASCDGAEDVDDLPVRAFQNDAIMRCEWV